MTGNILTLGSMEAFPSLTATQDADAVTDRALAATRRRTPARRQMILAPNRADVTAAFAAATRAATRPSRRPMAPLSAVVMAGAAPAACLHC